MSHYLAVETCRMELLGRFLDDPEIGECGLCDNCTRSAITAEVDPAVVEDARDFVCAQDRLIEPGKRLADNSTIPATHRTQVGRALSLWGDAGWDRVVQEVVEGEGRFDDELIGAAATLVRRRWGLDPAPTWLTFVPSQRRPALVADLAERLAHALGAPSAHPSVVTRFVRERLLGPAPEPRSGPEAQQVAPERLAFGVGQHGGGGGAGGVGVGEAVTEQQEAA